MKQAFVRLSWTLALSGCCAALALAGCAKHTDTTQTTTTTDTSTATPGADAASAAPAGAAGTTGTATEAPGGTATTSAGTAAQGATPAPASSGGAFAFIDVPVYPGASEDKSQGMSMSGNGGSVTIVVYMTKDDAKTVSDWYKSHLPANWKNAIMTANDKTVGTFSNEGPPGDQSVIVGDSNGTTRIQVATKHGK